MSTALFLPTWAMIRTKLLELRKRRGLMIAAFVLTIGIPVLVLGIRLIFHVADPKSYGPAGIPSVFQALCDFLSEFGFIIGATLGASAGSTDLTEGVFRHLVVTGRSRVALYLARIPAGLAILLSFVAASFLVMCLVTSFDGSPEPSSIAINGFRVPTGLTESGLQSWVQSHQSEADQAFLPNKVSVNGSPIPTTITPAEIQTAYNAYTLDELVGYNPSDNEMVKIGLWLELEAGIGFVVGLGLGALTGHRTVTTIMLIGLEIIITPILSSTVIPYFLDGQRVVVGIAMDQLRPIYLLSTTPGGGSGGHGPRGVLLGRGGNLGIPAMPTWAMIAVIVGWIVGWSVIGAWRMATRDA
jgi:hypothetical protein